LSKDSPKLLHNADAVIDRADDNRPEHGEDEAVEEIAAERGLRIQNSGPGCRPLIRAERPGTWRTKTGSEHERAILSALITPRSVLKVSAKAASTAQVLRKLTSVTA
jgi:hypothetical protein